MPKLNSAASWQLAWALGMKATGIELLDKRFNASCDATAKLDTMPTPKFASDRMRLDQGSFLTLDWSDADVVFTDSVMFSPETMAALSDRARALKEGARIVSKKKFTGDAFKSLGQLPLNVSWSRTTLDFQVQRKVTPADRSGLSTLPSVRSCCRGPCDHNPKVVHGPLG